MKYHIHPSDTLEFYQNRYLRTEKEVNFCSSPDIIEADPLKMSIKAWKTSNFKAQFINIESSKDLQVSGGIANNMVMLHFVSKGDTSLSYNTTRFLKMDENTNTIFTTVDEDIIHSFSKNKQYEYFKVFLPYDFILSIGNKNAEIFEPIIDSVEKQRPLILQNKHHLTTMEMHMVIDQIKNCQSMGNIAPLYFDNKIQELLLLQLQQKNNQKYTTCTRHKHYRDQINQARNIVENHYQNPPTINELAISVGMSATVLKASFKLFFGTTIYGYIFEYRMNLARKLLNETSYTIAEIAERSGYEHASHFTTAFKRRFQISPVAFRKKIS